MAVTQAWSEFSSRARFDDLPEDVVAQCKRYILDHIGCAFGGASVPEGGTVIAVARELGAGAQSSIIGSGEPGSAMSAAYANARNSNLLDHCEVSYNITHVGGVPLFAALAIGERHGHSGTELILANTVGFEFSLRLFLAAPAADIDPVHGYRSSFGSGPASTALGAGVASSVMYGFDASQSAAALGAAAFFTPIPCAKKYHASTTGNMRKYVDMGWCAVSGMTAANSIRLGDEGITDVLDEPQSIWRVLGRVGFDESVFLDELGSSWKIMESGFKPYPACRWLHTAIRQVELIVEANDLKPEDIDSIHLICPPATFDNSFVKGDAWADKSERIMAEAQFSYPFSIACAVHGIPAGPQWASREVLESPAIDATARKVTRSADPTAGERIANYSGPVGKINARALTQVEVKTRKGDFSSESTDVWGDQWNPAARWTEAQVVQKFRTNLAPWGNDRAVGDLVDLVLNLESVRDLRMLGAACRRVIEDADVVPPARASREVEGVA